MFSGLGDKETRALRNYIINQNRLRLSDQPLRVDQTPRSVAYATSLVSFSRQTLVLLSQKQKAKTKASNSLT